MRTIICACLAAMSLAACGGGGGDGNTDPAPPPAAVTFNFDAALSAALGNGIRFSGLASTATPGLTIDIAYIPQTPRTVNGVVVKRTHASLIGRVNGVPSEQYGGVDALDYTTSPVRFVRSMLLDPMLVVTEYSGTGSLPTASPVGTSGPFHTSVITVGGQYMATQTTTWSLEASDSAAQAWACLATVSTAPELSQKECYRIDAAGAVLAARLTFQDGGQTVTFQ